MNNSKKNRILIIKLGAIGDVVMSLPMLEAIREKYGDAHITWLTGSAPLPILKCSGMISEIITADDAAILKGSIPARLKELFRIWAKLFLRRFDLVVIPYRDKRYRLLALTVRAEKYRDFMGDCRKNSIIPGRYHAAEYRKLIDDTDDRKMQIPVFPQINTESNEKTDEMLAGLKNKKIILAPGGSKNLLADDKLRRWPLENYRQLAELLSGLGFDVILIGGPADTWVEKEFEKLKITNLIGRTSLTELIGLFNKCDLFITHDTGTLQIAKLSSINAIGLFGPVNPDERIGANENVTAIWGGKTLPCSPCYDGKHFADCDNNICMKNITPSEIIQLIRQSGKYGI